MIQPDLEYGVVAFLPSLPATERQRLLSPFRRGVRAAAGTHPQADVQQILDQLSLCDIHMRWILHLGLFVFHCCKEPAPQCLRNIYQSIKSAYNTRGKTSSTLEIALHNTKSGVNSVSNQLCLFWNALPQS